MKQINDVGSAWLWDDTLVILLERDNHNSWNCLFVEGSEFKVRNVAAWAFTREGDGTDPGNWKRIG